MSLVQDLESKILGTTDSVTTCFCCGKSNLKKTVVFKVKEEHRVEYCNNTFGEYVFLGSHCATLVFAAAKKKLDKSNIRNQIKMEDIMDIELTADFMGKGQVKLTYHWASKAVTMTAINGETRDNLTVKDIENYWERLSGQWQGNIELFIEKVETSYKGIKLF